MRMRSGRPNRVAGLPLTERSAKRGEARQGRTMGSSPASSHRAPVRTGRCTAVGRHPFLCALDGTDLTDRTHWENRAGLAFCTLAELEAGENDADQAEEAE